MMNHTNGNSTNRDLYHYPTPTRILDIVVLSAFIGIGTVGNIMIITVVLSSRVLKKLCNMFIVNVAVADLVVTAYLLPFTLMASVTGNYVQVPILCQINGFILTGTCGVSILSLCLLAVDRWLFLCHNHKYKTFFNSKSVPIIITVIWLWVILAISPTQYGWGSIAFLEKSGVCVFDHRSNLSFTVFLMIVGIIIPGVVTMFCYCRILKNVRATMKAVSKFAEANHGQSKYGEQRLKQLLALFVAFALFILFWTPYSFVIVIDFFNIVPEMVVKVVSWFGLGNSCVNSFVYGFLNPAFRKQYKKLVCFWEKQEDSFYGTQSRSLQQGRSINWKDRLDSLPASNIQLNTINGDRKSRNGSIQNINNNMKETKL